MAPYNSFLFRILKRISCSSRLTLSPIGPITQKGCLIDGLHELSHIPRTHYTYEETHQYPGQNFENSSFGARWLDILPNGLEYTLNYLHGYGTLAGGRTD